jgi:glycosyltransferase involved in cell wall biosynthesis
VPRALVGLMFFPRGGSSHVVRALATALPAEGWNVTIVSGHREGHGNAQEFFAGLDVRAVDFTRALAAGEPMRADPPMHPSFEDRPDAPDRIFASLDDDLYEHQVAAWSQALSAAGAAEADVLYLHHLTPLNEAALRVAPDVPVVSHLHGTELLMLEEIDQGAPARWTHAGAWAERMRRWAQRSRAVITQSESQVQRAADALGIDPERCTVVPNGFDPERFDRREVDRRPLWQRHLVDEPQGWSPGGEPGSVAYTVEQVERITQEPVLLYVGRFTAVKRIGLLVRAFARAQEADGNRAALVLLGGHPGEWEGEHPLEAVEASGAHDVFLAGWHDHHALPDFLNAVDAIVLPSVREQFGQVLVEGMACGLPPIAVNRHGPAEIVEDGRTGWLVEPDDEQGLAAALTEVIGDGAERDRRGEAAREAARARYAWPSLAGRVSETLKNAVIEAQH